MFGPIFAKPGSAKKNLTGSWRTGLKPKFFQKDCIGCQMCLIICPEGCIIREEKNIFQTNYDYCKGCGNCVEICPRQDIVMVEE